MKTVGLESPVAWRYEQIRAQETEKARCERALLRFRLMAGRDLCLYLWLSNHPETAKPHDQGAENCG